MIPMDRRRPGTGFPPFDGQNRYCAPMSNAGFRATLYAGPRRFSGAPQDSNSPAGSGKKGLIEPTQDLDSIAKQPMTRVLIVDDQPGFRRQLRAVLAFSGLEVVGEAGSVDEALSLLPEISADLAIVDVEMPGINGIEGTPLLKKASPRLRVILVSAYANHLELFTQAAARVGAECFISKERLDPDVIRGWEHPLGETA